MDHRTENIFTVYRSARWQGGGKDKDESSILVSNLHLVVCTRLVDPNTFLYTSFEYLPSCRLSNGCQDKARLYAISIPNARKKNRYTRLTET